MQIAVTKGPLFPPSVYFYMLIRFIFQAEGMFQAQGNFLLGAQMTFAMVLNMTESSLPSMHTVCGFEMPCGPQCDHNVWGRASLFAR